MKAVAAAKKEVRFTANIFARQRIGSRVFRSVQILKNPSRPLLHGGFNNGPIAAGRSFHLNGVIVHVSIWQRDAVLTAPAGAFFRKGSDWAAFVIRDGRARSAIVTLGQRNNLIAQITSGLSEGDAVVLHPSDRISEGVAVAQREVE